MKYMNANNITERDNALFEAGIKLGALYHQFTGSPINLKTVDCLEKAIAQSISAQPYVKNINVTINKDIIKSKINNEFGYCELEGCMLDVNLEVKYKNTHVQVSLKFDEKMQYPLMQIVKINT